MHLGWGPSMVEGDTQGKQKQRRRRWFKCSKTNSISTWKSADCVRRRKKIRRFLLLSSLFRLANRDGGKREKNSGFYGGNFLSVISDSSGISSFSSGALINPIPVQKGGAAERDTSRILNVARSPAKTTPFCFVPLPTAIWCYEHCMPSKPTEEHRVGSSWAHQVDTFIHNLHQW